MYYYVSRLVNVTHREENQTYVHKNTFLHYVSHILSKQLMSTVMGSLLFIAIVQLYTI